MRQQDLSQQLQQRVQDAAERRKPLRLCGGGSKARWGRSTEGAELALAEHRGVIDYEPTELVISARAGTRIAEIEAVLAGEGQMLGFEPPAFAGRATLGGTLAGNFSGPRRPYAGAARDFVLGTRVLNGRGEDLRFGGSVMKNVAGYDLSRLMCGAWGTLGVLLEASLKVLPCPEQQATLVLDGLSARAALDYLHRWKAQPLPISASCFLADRLLVRLSGTERALLQGARVIGGSPMAEDQAAGFWLDLKEQRLDFFQGEGTLWRLSVASNEDPAVDGVASLMEWGGALRWLYSDEPAETLRERVRRVGGHALRLDANAAEQPFQPLSAPLQALHQRLKQAFDPYAILNPGKIYADL